MHNQVLAVRQQQALALQGLQEWMVLQQLLAAALRDLALGTGLWVCPTAGGDTGSTAVYPAMPAGRDCGSRHAPKLYWCIRAHAPMRIGACVIWQLL